MRTSFAIALGSNMPHARYGGPRGVLRAAIEALDKGPLSLCAVSPIMASAPIGPSIRTYANAVALIETALDPDSLLTHLKLLEQDFGRRSGGQRWRARPLDLDIILWSQGPFIGQNLCIPHVQMASRDFVLTPLCALLPDWRHPFTGRTVRHMKARLDQKRPAA